MLASYKKKQLDARNCIAIYTWLNIISHLVIGIIQLTQGGQSSFYTFKGLILILMAILLGVMGALIQMNKYREFYIVWGVMLGCYVIDCWMGIMALKDVKKWSEMSGQMSASGAGICNLYVIQMLACNADNLKRIVNEQGYRV